MQKIIFFLSLILLTSCASKKDITYFQFDEIEKAKASNEYKIVFKSGDFLEINVSALNPEAVQPFNLTSTTNSAGRETTQSYIIDSTGNIEFPLIGTVKLAGLTRNEAVKILKSKIHPEHVKNPTINIRISNFSITVLGNVKKPGKFNIPNERITVLEAIGLAGDLNVSGIRTIKVFREENNTKKEYILDLRSNKVFSSPVYYLQQNDVVYVDYNKASSQDAVYNKNTGLFISIASLLLSLITIITR